MSTLPASASVDQIPPHHFLYLATDGTEAKIKIEHEESRGFASP